MTLDQQTAAPAATPTHAPASSGGEGGQPNPNHVDENRTGQSDPFTRAFNKATDEIDARARETEAAQRAQEQQDEQQAQTEEPAPAAPAAPEKPATLEPPAYWARERKEAFRFQPREVQEAWLNEDPAPNSRWSTEVKEAFAKFPREAKELYLTQIGEIERGVNQKFQALAAERKFAEDIKAAVPEPIRQYMAANNLTEAQVFGKLIALQQQSMQDPASYIRNFVAGNKLDPATLFNIQVPEGGQIAPEMVRGHPEFMALKSQFDALNREVQAERAALAEKEDRRLQAEIDEIASGRDGDGKPLYPYIRLLKDSMASKIESNPELFGSMGVKERFATAYSMALEDFPELMPLRTAPPKPADVPVVDAHTAAEQKRQENLDRAITPKPRVSTPPLNGAGKTGDPLDDAINAASRKLGMTR